MRCPSCRCCLASAASTAAFCASCCSCSSGCTGMPASSMAPVPIADLPGPKFSICHLSLHGGRFSGCQLPLTCCEHLTRSQPVLGVCERPIHPLHRGQVFLERAQGALVSMLAAVLMRVFRDDAAHAGSVRDGHCRHACSHSAILPLVNCRAGAAVRAGYGKQEPETLLDCWMTGEQEFFS